MGGNALKITKTRRFQRLEYLEEVEFLLWLFCGNIPNTRFNDVKAYHTKKDFGDIDMLVEHTTTAKTEVEELLIIFGVTEIIKNGLVWSVGWPSLGGDYIQLDLIFTPAEHYDFSYNYYSWSDFGNLVGRIGYNLGFKFGHKGLLYVVRDGDYKAGEITVTDDFDEAMEFLGYHDKQYKKGFETLEDMFKYVASGGYFMKHYYPLEGRSHRARTRDAKRASYRAFLEWVDDVQPCDNIECGCGIKIYKLLQARESFPMFAAGLDALLFDMQRKKAIKLKFNGKIVQEITGYEGEKLGAFMQMIKQEPEFQKEYLYNCDPSTIIVNIKFEWQMVELVNS